MTQEEIVVDGENALMGRLASFAAKKALLGHKVIIVNAEKVQISGSKENIVGKYLQLRRRRTARLSSIPDRIMKRAIRGMLSYKEGRGEQAFARIMCYTGTPKEFQDKKKIRSKEKRDFITLDEVSKMLK